MSFTQGMSFIGLFLSVAISIFALALSVQAIKEIPYWIMCYRARAAGVDKTDSMNGEMFEEWLAQQFKNAGYEVRRTPYQGDHGADLIVTSPKGTKIAVQAKKLGSRKARVGVKVLGEPLRGKNYYGCDMAMVVTNQGYTEPAISEARRSGIILMDRKKLISFVEKHKKSAKLQGN